MPNWEITEKSELRERRRAHIKSLLVLASVCPSIGGNEIVLRYGRGGILIDVLKSITTLSSLTLAFLVGIDHWKVISRQWKSPARSENARQGRKKAQLKWYLLFFANVIVRSFAFLLCLFFCPPTVDVEFSVRSTNHLEGVHLTYFFDSVATAVVTIRAVLLLDSVRLEVIPRTHELRTSALKCGVNVHTWGFFVRWILFLNDRLTLFISLLVILFYTAYLIRILEYPINPKLYANYSSALWLSIVSISSVGYGDMYPQTHLGKIATAAAIILGLLLTSIVVSVANAGLQLKEKQFYVVTFEKLRILTERVETSAARCIAAGFKMMMIRKRKAQKKQQEQQQQKMKEGKGTIVKSLEDQRKSRLKSEEQMEARAALLMKEFRDARVEKKEAMMATQDRLKVKLEQLVEDVSFEAMRPLLERIEETEGVVDHLLRSVNDMCRDEEEYRRNIHQLGELITRQCSNNNIDNRQMKNKQMMSSRRE